MKKLMILGAGIYQVPLIRKAKNMGLETFVVSIPGHYPGFELADRLFYLDTRDVAGILKAAKEEKIDGIMTTGTDVAVKAIGAVCDALNLPGISEKAAFLVTDKALMKEAFRRGGVPTSAFHIVKTKEEALRAARDLGYPVMIKACDVSGSRGISKVTDDSGVETAFVFAMAATHTDHLIVEKMNVGYEIGLDGFVRDGKVVLCLPHTKYVGRTEATTVPIGHGFPFPGNEALHKAIREALEAIVSATGMNNCAVNADVFVTGDHEVSVIEAGGRCGATTIPELITWHTGVDYYKAMIMAALGEPFDMTPTCETPCIGQLLLSPRDGIITAVNEAGIEALRSDSVSIGLDYGVGDRVEKMKNGTDRIGQIVVKSGEKSYVDELVSRVQACLTIE